MPSSELELFPRAPASGLCAVCKKDGKACTGCYSVYYCGPEHQMEHLKQHKEHCKPYETKKNSELGRYMVATRDIPQGSIIFKEAPFVVAPHLNRGKWSCVGCFRVVDLEMLVYCSFCGGPLCSKVCQTSAWHSPECEEMRKTGFIWPKPRTQPLECRTVCLTLLPLRCLLLPKKRKEKLKCNERIEKCKVERPEENARIVETVKSITQRFGEAAIDRAWAMDVHGSMLYTDVVENYERDPKVKGLYLRMSHLVHECVPNAKVFILDTPTYDIALVASTDIKSGSIITTSFTDEHLSAGRRREIVRSRRFENCTCKRCKDPKDLGLYVGSPCCNKCRVRGVKALMISKDPLDDEAVWCCQKCDFEIPNLEELQIKMAREDPSGQLFHSFLMGEPQRLKRLLSIKDHEEFLENTLYPKGCFHEGSSFVLRVKYFLLKAYGGGTFKTDHGDFPMEILQKKLTLCHELYYVIDRLSPGVSLTRGVLNVHLFQTRLGMAEKYLSPFSTTYGTTMPKPLMGTVMLDEAEVVLEEIKTIFITPKLKTQYQFLRKRLMSFRDLCIQAQVLNMNIMG